MLVFVEGTTTSWPNWQSRRNNRVYVHTTTGATTMSSVRQWREEKRIGILDERPFVSLRHDSNRLDWRQRQMDYSIHTTPMSLFQYHSKGSTSRSKNDLFFLFIFPFFSGRPWINQCDAVQSFESVNIDYRLKEEEKRGSVYVCVCGRRRPMGTDSTSEKQGQKILKAICYNNEC